MDNKYLGFIFGILMVSQDLNTYYLYILLLIISPHTIRCTNFLDYYTIFILINTIMSGVFYPISGWITDITSDKSALVFLVSNIVQLILILLQILPYYFSELLGHDSWIVLCVLWELSQLVSIQN